MAGRPRRTDLDTLMRLARDLDAGNRLTLRALSDAAGGGSTKTIAEALKIYRRDRTGYWQRRQMEVKDAIEAEIDRHLIAVTNLKGQLIAVEAETQNDA